MPTNLLVRILALTVVAAAALIGQFLSGGRLGHPRKPFSWACQVGPYACRELRDPLMEEALRSTGGHYLWREYETRSGKIEFFAAAAPGYSAKEPPACLRLQGWVVIRDEARHLQIATGWVPVREYVLASPLSEPPWRTIVAIGLWKWGENKFVNNYLWSRLYGLLDSTLWPKMSSIQVYTTLNASYTDANLDQAVTLLRGFLQHWPADGQGEPFGPVALTPRRGPQN